jgi:large subunit ribosomal protein L7/L12
MSANTNKFIEEIGSMSVLELANLVKALEEAFGVSASMPSVAAPAADAGESAVAEVKSEFKVVLKEAGDKKIDVIKALRKVTTLNLSDAKKAVDDAPTVIGESVTKDDAQKMKTELEAAGAKVELS